MEHRLPDYPEGATLVGGGPVTPGALAAARAHAPRLIAADGGANALAALGAAPEAIIGDLDSLADRAQWRARLGDRLIHVAEQDSTDFEKCLARVRAPLIIAVGFTGGRVDHQLAALHAVVADPRPVILLDDDDLAVSVSRPLTLALTPGDRVSLFPLRPATGHAEGLRWPFEGLAMEAGGRIGTSNEAAAHEVRIAFDRPGAVLILPPRRLAAVIDALSRPAG